MTKEKLSHLYYRAFPGRRGERGLDSWFFFGAPDNIDWGMLAHKNATEHLERCFAAMEAMEEGADADEIDDPSCAPFCGCDTCVTRETLYAAWGTIAQATLAGFEADYSNR
jgi:hypothetical protein